MVGSVSVHGDADLCQPNVLFCLPEYAQHIGFLLAGNSALLAELLLPEPHTLAPAGDVWQPDSAAESLPSDLPHNTLHVFLPLLDNMAESASLCAGLSLHFSLVACRDAARMLAEVTWILP